MIKRAKWKILHDGDADEENSDAMSESSRGSSANDGSSLSGGETDAALLKMLLETDQELGAWVAADQRDATQAELSESSGDSCSEDDNGSESLKKSIQSAKQPAKVDDKAQSYPAKMKPDDVMDPHTKSKRTRDKRSPEPPETQAEVWKESSVRTCDLCPDKLLLNDGDVAVHLESKRHKKALKKSKKDNMSAAEISGRKAKNARKRAKREARLGTGEEGNGGITGDVSKKRSGRATLTRKL